MSRRTAAILVACGGAYLAFLDTTIVNTSFPDIAASFPEATRSDLSWILDAYFIVVAALLVPAGALGDRLGRKRLFLGGVIAFVLTSLVCAVAPTWELLVAGRVLQAIAAAVMVPVSLALVLPLFALERRATGVGLWGAAAALAAASGPPLGGLLVEVADWRWIFLVNLPLGLLAVAAGRRVLDESRDEAATGLPDLPGSALSAFGLGALALGIVEGPSWGWGSPEVVGCFAAAAVLLAIVARRCTRHPRPVVDPSLMAIASFRRANVGNLLFSMGFFSAILGNILFLTSVWRYSVLDAGLATVPGPLLAAFVAGPAGRLADRFGHRAVIVPGALIYAAALLVLRGAGLEPDYVGTWLPGMLLAGLGIGLAYPALGSAAVSEIEPERFATAGAVNGAFRQIGAVLGTAILVAIVGEPATLAAAEAVAGEAYVFGAIASVAAAAVALALPRRRALAAPAPVPA
ncbi:MAG TPA: MFS transporter [Solirubrobacteraceae bacterium]|nr:MFS transporter [Solirubrobacteraceae bacterium]